MSSYSCMPSLMAAIEYVPKNQKIMEKEKVINAPEGCEIEKVENIDGAVFATETIIEKACEWLKNNTVTVINDVCTYTASSYDISKEEFVEDFKKAMEGGEQ